MSCRVQRWRNQIQTLENAGDPLGHQPVSVGVRVDQVCLESGVRQDPLEYVRHDRYTPLPAQSTVLP